MKRFAFTLVELLVVIAVIALLITMIVPSYNSARSMSRRTACQMNLHSIHEGFLNNMAQGTSYSGPLCKRDDWGTASSTTGINLSQVFTCPEVGFNSVSTWSYGINYQAGASAASTQAAPNHLNKPPLRAGDVKILMLDYDDKIADPTTDITQMLANAALRHRATLNILYADGTAHCTGPSQIDPANAANADIWNR